MALPKHLFFNNTYKNHFFISVESSIFVIICWRHQLMENSKVIGLNVVTFELLQTSIH